MTKTEKEFQNDLTSLEGQFGWNVEDITRRTNFRNRRMAALALVQVDPEVDQAFDEADIEALAA